jgi:DNA-binding LytR/AlgR family response regulator
MQRHYSKYASLVRRSSAREIAAALDPVFQRCHSSAFCAAVNHIRDITIGHPPIR